MAKQRYLTEGYISKEVIADNNGKLGIVAHRCRNCGKLSFPAYELCPYCSSDNTDRVFLSDEATVLAATVTYAPVPPYKPPFTLAMVDIDDEVRTLVRVESKDLPKVGDKLRLKFGVLFTETEYDRKKKVSEDVDVVGYYYVPVAEESEAAEN